MKIYTKTGDRGNTALLGGVRVSKDCLEINVIGEIDELNSCIGVLIEEVEDDRRLRVRNTLRVIQHNLFTLGSMIAAIHTTLGNIPQLRKSDITRLEKSIDRMSAELPPLTQFILPGGGEAGSYAFFVRAVCRRAERSVVTLAQEHTPLNRFVVPYLNRLSDFLFVLARWLNHREGIQDIPWEKPRSRSKKSKKA